MTFVKPFHSMFLLYKSNTLNTLPHRTQKKNMETLRFKCLFSSCASCFVTFSQLHPFKEALPAYPKHVARSLCSTAIGATKRRRCLAWLRPLEKSYEIATAMIVTPKYTWSSWYFPRTCWIGWDINYTVYVRKIFLFNVSLWAPLAAWFDCRSTLWTGPNFQRWNGGCPVNKKLV